MLYSLRRNPNLLTALKEQLFTLWGDLEEQKCAILKSEAKGKNDLPSSSLESELCSSPPQKGGEQPDIDSDIENEHSNPNLSRGNINSSVLQERDANNASNSDQKTPSGLVAKNKAFTCCIKQYGIKVKEDDPKKANAGNGQRWQRKFGLFGTQIM